VTSAILSAEAIHVAHSGQAVLSDLTVELPAAGLIGLIGPNGAGKSTLLRCLAGLQVPDRGRVNLGGRPLLSLPLRQRGRTLAYLAQSAPIHWPLTVERLVALGRLPHLGPWSGPATTDAAAIRSAMANCSVGHLAERCVTSLSGGERALALLARTLAVQPQILLVDEPVAGLDPCHQLQVMELLASQAASGRLVIVVLHDLTLASRFCHRLLLLKQGRLMRDGIPATVLQPDILAAAYHVDFLQMDSPFGTIPIPFQRLPATF
jgi:iron complex transport system ATP-binding protein